MFKLLSFLHLFVIGLLWTCDCEVRTVAVFRHEVYRTACGHSGVLELRI